MSDVSDKNLDGSSQTTSGSGGAGLWWIILLAMLLATGGAWWLLLGHHRVSKQALPAQSIPNDIEMHLSKVHLHGVSRGKVVWEMVADDFDQSKSRPSLHIQGLSRVAVLQNGKQALNVSADSVEKNTISGDITMNGNVCVTGEKLDMHTSSVTWQALRGVLSFPMPFTAQLGDYNLTASGRLTYDIQENHLRCNRPLTVTMQGDTIKAGGADVDMAHQCLTLSNMVSGDFAVASLQDWAAGHHIPCIPQIPPGVQTRYREYCQQQGLPLPAPWTPAVTGTRPPGKGVRP